MAEDQIKSYIFLDDGTFPNNPLPLLQYKQAFSADPKVNPADIEKVFYSGC